MMNKHLYLARALMSIFLFFSLVNPSTFIVSIRNFPSLHESSQLAYSYCFLLLKSVLCTYVICSHQSGRCTGISFNCQLMCTPFLATTTRQSIFPCNLRYAAVSNVTLVFPVLCSMSKANDG